MHNLWNVTNRGLDLSGVIDGNTLTRSVNCATAGIKIIDYGTICHVSKKPINICYNNAGVDSNILMQSRDRCFPMKMIVGQESKVAFSEFEDWYQFMTDLTLEDNDSNDVYAHMKPMNISR